MDQLLRDVHVLLSLFRRVREEEAADRAADEAREKVLQSKQRAAEDPERPLRPSEKGFRCGLLHLSF